MTIIQQLEKTIELFESMPRIKYYVSIYVSDFGDDGQPFLAKMEETMPAMNMLGKFEMQPTGTDILIMSPDTARLLAEKVGGDTGRELVRLADDAILNHNPAN